MKRYVDLISVDEEESIKLVNLTDLEYQSDKFGYTIIAKTPFNEVLVDKFVEDTTKYQKVRLVAQDIEFAAITLIDNSLITLSIDTSGDEIQKVLRIFVPKG